MKKLINDPRDVVGQMLEGLVGLDERLALLAGENVVLRRDAAELAARGGVALISGGGAGHEPAHAGYVGEGLLTAAVSGDVFTSPSTDAVLAAIRAVGGQAGVLLIVKNYTGDRLNFGLAADIARTEGIPVEMVIVDDDVALGTGGGAGRRGIAGTVLVHKVAGACAAAGLPLAEIKAEVEAAIAATGTMGVALSGCTVPGADSAGFDLAANEIELGLGIHGEAGIERAHLDGADALVETLIDRIVADRGFGANDQTALLVNGLGGTPAMELAIVARAALAALRKRGITVRRSWCGSNLTALDMQGCSLSLMRLDAGRLARLDAPAFSASWQAGATPPAEPNRVRMAAGAESVEATAAELGPKARRFRHVLSEISNAIRVQEARLTTLDQAVGDGDLGFSLRRGADSLDKAFAGNLPPDEASLLRLVSLTLRRSIGGTSGPLYAIAALRASEVLRKTNDPSAHAWAEALTASCTGISELGGAARGDRTMLDALIPAAEAFSGAVGSGAPVSTALAQAVSAARQGAAATAGMTPRKGRSSYLGDRVAGHPDPGAEAVAIWLAALAHEFSEAGAEAKP